MDKLLHVPVFYWMQSLIQALYMYAHGIEVLIYCCYDSIQTDVSEVLFVISIH